MTGIAWPLESVRGLLLGRRGRVPVALLVLVSWAALSVAVPAPAGASGAPAAAGPTHRGWFSQRSGTAATLTAVSFPDRLHGHAVGSAGTVVATNDGGTTWSRQYACTSSAPCQATSRDRIASDLDGVSFPDPLHGWAVGARGAILATADGGATWTQQLACAQGSATVVQGYCQPLSADRVSQRLRSVSFVDSARGWAVGSGETMLATTDGGHTWVQQIACLWQTPGYDPDLDNAVGRNGVPSPNRAPEGPCPPRPESIPARDLTSVSFVDRDHGVAIGGGGWAVFTEDGGLHWYGGQVPGTRLQLRGVVMVVANVDDRNQDTIHAVGVAGQMLVSGLKGDHWWYGTGGNDQLAGQAPATDQSLNAVSFTDRMNGHAVGEHGVMVATSDEGQHWSQEPSGTELTLNGVSFPDAHHGFAVGEAGTILGYHGGGAPGLAVTAVGPRQLPEGGAIPVGITGRGFTGAEEVNFGKEWAAGFTVDSDTHITAMAPRAVPGQYDVTVVSHGMTSEIGAADQITVMRPRGGAWAQTGRCPGPCDGAAVRLQDGRVLVAGKGDSDGQASTAAELFDPSTGRWQSTAPMRVPRRDPVALLLGNGRVLVAGGYIKPDEATASAEIYDPASGRWSRAARMHQPRAEFSGVLLPDGTVLVAGGYETLGVTVAPFVDRRFGDAEAGSDHSTASSEVYDPVTDTWRKTGDMHRTRAFDTLVRLRTGAVLAVGDDSLSDSHPDVDATAELYDPRTGAWARTGPMSVARDFVSAVALEDGRVLAAGGVVYPFDRPAYGLPFAEIYDPRSGTWTPTGPMVFARVFQTMTLLADGRVLSTGGRYGADTYCPPCDALSQAEIFDPALNEWQLVAPASEARLRPVGVRLPNGSVLVTGRDGDSEVFTPAEPAGSGEVSSVPWFAWVLIGASALSGVAAMVAWRRRRRRTPPPVGGAPRRPRDTRSAEPVSSGDRR